jgi:SAM-dependent methyltransferase
MVSPVNNMSRITKTGNCACPVCAGNDISQVITINDIPLHCNVLYPTAEEAADAPRGDIVLTYCRQCGHIFNSAHDSSKMKYSRVYENSLHYSPRFQEYASSLAKRLVETYDLHSKRVLEIGCGKGDFLNLLCELGGNKGIGFDPSYENDRLPADSHERFSVINDFYSEKYAHYKADLIVCRHVLEHIESPRNFLNMLRQSIGSNENAIVFFEVPYVMYTLKDFGIWDLIYEHCGYFSRTSLSYLFRLCNFIPKRVDTAFGSQFLQIEACPGDKYIKSMTNESLDILESFVKSFANRYFQKLGEWQAKTREFNKQSRKIVLWGAGSKGMTFLNTINADDRIQYVVDINPHKQGMYAPGVGQKIVHPGFLKKYQPDVVIVMNPIYLQEIKNILTKMNLKPSVISA